MLEKFDDEQLILIIKLAVRLSRSSASSARLRATDGQRKIKSTVILKAHFPTKVFLLQPLPPFR